MASAPVKGIRAAPFSSRYSGGWYIDVLVDLLQEHDSIITRQTALGPSLTLRRFDGVTAQKLMELAKGHGQGLTAEEVIFLRAHPHAVSIESDEVEVRWFRDELAANAFWFDAVRLERTEPSLDLDRPPMHSSGVPLH